MTEPLPRLAFCSAVPPRASGVADYCAVLLPVLAERFSITLFTERTPPAKLRPAGCKIRSLTDLGDWPEEDPILYHVGNDSGTNGAVYRAALRRPGIVVLHEYMLHHLVRHLALASGGSPAYIREMGWAYGAGGEAAARRLVEIGSTRELWRFPLFERLVDTSLGVIVHNRSAQSRVLASRPDALVLRVPHLIRATAQSDTNGPDREALGLPRSDLVFGSFGFVTESKQPEVALRAFAALRRQHPDSIYLIVGETATHPDFEGMLHGELGRNVLVTGRVGIERFQDYMHATDIAVNLRYPSGGETSGTLMRLMNLAKPTIVSRSGSFEEIPDDCCIHVSPQRHAERDLLAAMLLLADDPAPRRAVGFRAREHVYAHHSPQIAARAYAEAIHTIRHEGRGPRALPDPSILGRKTGTRDLLTAEVGGALFDLGLDGRDDLLEEVAGILVELGLD